MRYRPDPNVPPSAGLGRPRRLPVCVLTATRRNDAPLQVLAGSYQEQERCEVRSLAGQHLSPVSLRHPDQLRQARCPNPEANWEVRFASPDQWSVGLVLVSHWLHKQVDSERRPTGVGIDDCSHGLRLRGLRLG